MIAAYILGMLTVAAVWFVFEYRLASEPVRHNVPIQIQGQWYYQVEESRYFELLNIEDASPIA